MRRVVVDGATSEWIPIVSGVPQGGVLGPHFFFLYTSEMFELVENRLYAMQMTPHYWQLSTSQQTDLLLLPLLTGIFLGFSSGPITCMILNIYKTTALVISRSRTVNLALGGDFVLSGISIPAIFTTSTSCGVRLNSKLFFKDNARGSLLFCRESQELLF